MCSTACSSDCICVCACVLIKTKKKKRMMSCCNEHQLKWLLLLHFFSSLVVLTITVRQHTYISVYLMIKNEKQDKEKRVQQNENANRYASITFSLAFFIFLFSLSFSVHVVFSPLDQIDEGHLLRIDLTRRCFDFSTFFLSLSCLSLSLSIFSIHFFHTFSHGFIERPLPSK